MRHVCMQLEIVPSVDVAWTCTLCKGKQDEEQNGILNGQVFFMLHRNLGKQVVPFNVFRYITESTHK